MGPMVHEMIFFFPHELVFDAARRARPRLPLQAGHITPQRGPVARSSRHVGHPRRSAHSVGIRRLL